MADRIKVLVVDDHKVFVDALVLGLSFRPEVAVVGTAHRGEDAAGEAEACDPDVVLMDVRLPGIDGFEATRRLLRARPGAKVILLTAESPQRVAAGAGTCGASWVLDKTVPLEEVVDAIVRVERGERLLPEPPDAPPPSLTAREHEILVLLAEGLSNKEVASKLVVSVRTVDTHVRNVLVKLGARSKLEAVVTAARAGLVSVDGR